MAINLPTTKQVRRMFSAAMIRNDVEIVKSKTRDNPNYSGLDFELWHEVYSNPALKQKLRVVEFNVKFDNMDHLMVAMSEFESMLTLSGKFFDTKRSWKYRYGSNNKIIKVLSVIDTVGV